MTSKLLIVAGAIFLVVSTAFIVLDKLAEHDAARALIGNNLYLHQAIQAEGAGYTVASMMALGLSVIFLFLSGRRAQSEKKCPDCGKSADRDASLCPFCKRAL